MKPTNLGITLWTTRLVRAHRAKRAPKVSPIPGLRPDRPGFDPDPVTQGANRC